MSQIEKLSIQTLHFVSEICNQRLGRSILWGLVFHFKVITVYLGRVTFPLNGNENWFLHWIKVGHHLNAEHWHSFHPNCMIFWYNKISHSNFVMNKSCSVTLKGVMMYCSAISEIFPILKNSMYRVYLPNVNLNTNYYTRRCHFLVSPSLVPVSHQRNGRKLCLNQSV